MQFRRWILLGGVSLVLAAGCSSSSSPTAPSAQAPSTPSAVASPTVKVDVTYYTNDNTSDPDHFTLVVCPAGVQPSSGNCWRKFTANPALREPGTISWSGALAPGSYVAMVELYYADRLIDIAFSAAPGSAAGGVQRDSIRFNNSNTSSVNVYSYRPCGVMTTFRQRPDLPPLWQSQTYVAFNFSVSAGTTTPTC
jgi:hypothetical protein